jgi:transmembrane 9 superfamily protein 1
LTLGEVLDGDRMAKSLYKIQFDKNVEIEKLCSVTLSKSDIEKLQAAIEDFYYFEFIAGKQ